jgi:putative two-component system response regulator
MDKPAEHTVAEHTVMEAIDKRLAVELPAWESALDGGETPTILLVDASEVNRRLLKAILKAGRYRILEAPRPSVALILLDAERVDLVLVDLAIPEISGPDFCRLLKNNRATQLIPIVMTTTILNAENEIAGIDSGADDFLVKPLRPELVRARVRAMLRNKALVDSLEQAETILFALARSVEHRDANTGMHCERLATLSLALGRALGLPNSDQWALYRGGFLHDIGKVGIPDAVLFKRGPLDAHEWEIMRQHTIRGEEICRPMKSLAPVLPIIRSHHERWDGSGYPDGLSGEQIPLLARILQVADIYDALTTARPYKPAYSHEEAMKVLLAEAARGWRDAELVSLFAQTTFAQTITDQKVAQAAPSAEADKGMPASLENMRRELST